jgi:hypothetical protein
MDNRSEAYLHNSIIIPIVFIRCNDINGLLWVIGEEHFCPFLELILNPKRNHVWNMNNHLGPFTEC